MQSLDVPTITLISINMVQMLLNLLLILPVFDVVTLAKAIKIRSVEFQLPFRILGLMYNFLVIWHGIVTPIKKLSSIRLPKAIIEGLTAREKLIRIIDATNARRNFLLGCFSLFLSLTSLRLFTYIEFSAKLHEFSNLMATCNLVDVELKQKKNEAEFVIEDHVDEDSDDLKSERFCKWRSIAKLNERENFEIKKLLHSSSKILTPLLIDKQTSPNQSLSEEVIKND